MYSFIYLYSAGIRGQSVSLKNTELYFPVRLLGTKGGGLNKRRVNGFQKLVREGS